MAKASLWFGLAAGLLTGVMSMPARADLSLCNTMSYVIDVALAVESRGTATSRGWYRLDPGQCRTALQGALPAGDLFLHARVPALYGTSPLPQRGDTEFCVGVGDFSAPNARNCRSGQRPVMFTAAKPSPVEQSDKDFRLTLAEEAGYSEDQARDAGIQRLLAVAGYDPGPIDGVRGGKTDTAIRQFTQDNNLAITAAARSDFFAVLADAAQKPGNGFRMVQRHGASGHGCDRDRDRQRDHDPRLVSRRTGTLPAARHRPAGQAHLLVRRGGRCQRSGPDERRQAARLGRWHGAVHASGPVRYR